MNIFSRFAILLFLFHAAILPADEFDTPENIALDSGGAIERHGNQNYITIRRNQGRSISTNTSYTTIQGTIFPKTDQNLLPFLDVGFHVLDRPGDYAANIGGGLRYISEGSNRIFGINAFYDYRKDHRASYNQLGLGFELLGDFFNFRLNGYLPVGKTEFRLSRCIFNEYVGDYVIVKDSISNNLKGIDFEIEALIANRESWGAHLSIGTYYYDSASGSCQKNIIGSQCRLSADFGRYFNLSVLTSYDNVFHTKVMGQLSISVPFSFSYGDEATYAQQNSRVYSRVQRQDLTVLKDHCRWFWNY